MLMLHLEAPARLEQLLIAYGPVAVVVGSMIEGDMTLIFSGVVAHLGIFPLPVAMAAGWAGNFLSDCAWYWLGRRRGHAFRSSRLYQRVARRIEDLARRFGAWELLLVRFVYGTRNASMLFWGLQGLPFGRFAAIDALSCALGAALFTSLGYLVSGSAELLLGKVRRVELWLLGAVVAGIALVVLVHLTTKRRLHLDEDGPGEG
jgi:membrane protein DedA with SNARE-associated domain